MKVLLVYSGEPSKLPRLPLSLLALAAYVRKIGHEPTILDTRIERWITNDYTYPFEKFDVICIGSMTGPDLIPGIQISKYIKDRPVIWGGHHASAMPEQLLNEEYVDAVIVGEGERALSIALEDASVGRVEGVYNQEIEDMDKLPFPAYDLVDVNRYLDGKDEFSYEPSRGCPARCKFCYVNYFHKRKWRSKSVEKIQEEISIIREKYKPDKIKFVGDNFFVDKKNILELCKTFEGFKWSGSIRIDYLSKYTDEEMQLLKDSGCWLLALGAESGSQNTLDYIWKDIKPEQTLEVARKCVKFGIMPVFSMMVGLPHEEWEDVKQTLDLYDKLEKIGNVEINGIFVFRPFPGTVLYDECKKLGYKEPIDTEAWTDVKLLTGRMPWHKRGHELETISKISRFKYFKKHIKYFSKESIKKKLGIPYQLVILGILPFTISAHIRWKFRFFKLGYEWNLFFLILSFFSEVF